MRSIALCRAVCNDPCGRAVGHADRGPLIDCGRERLLGGFLGHIEIAGHANQRRDDPAPIGAIHRIHGRMYVHPHATILTGMGHTKNVGSGTNLSRKATLTPVPSPGFAGEGMGVRVFFFADCRFRQASFDVLSEGQT